MEKEYRSAKLLYIDIESTEVDTAVAGIHQISGLIEKDDEVLAQFDFYVRPHPLAKISDASLEYSGASRRKIMAYPSMYEIRQQLLEILNKHCDITDPTDRMFIVGYNAAGFDKPMMKRWFSGVGDDTSMGAYFFSPVKDVMVHCVEYFQYHKITPPNYSQESVARAMGIPVDKTRLHNAAYDVSITRTISKKIQAWMHR